MNEDLAGGWGFDGGGLPEGKTHDIERYAKDGNVIGNIEITHGVA